MKRLLLLMIFVCASIVEIVAKYPPIVRISVEPAEASIYVNGSFIGYGIGEFSHPKKDEVALIKIECEEYKSLTTKYYGTDKRPVVSFTLQSDGFYRASAASGIVNKYFTVDIDSTYYNVEQNKVDVSPAWKLLHQILLNYFDEISITDIYGGYLQTPWQYKTFELSNRQIRNRVTIRDISTPERVAFQIKIDSEVAGMAAARHGEFDAIDRIPKELEPMLQELQTRIGKVRSL